MATLSVDFSTSKTFKYGSLFTGIGGFDLGFEQTGMTPAFQVEIDPYCITTLEKHWPNVKRFTDVRANNPYTPVDLLCGGFPCQDVSVAGRREGLDGERSGLWFDFHRTIKKLHPGWVVIENVPGLLSSFKGEDFAVVLEGLTGTRPRVPAGGWGNSGFARGDYNVAWRVLDAQYFGVAQRRRRIFIVASAGSGDCAKVLFEPDSLSRNTPTRGQARQGCPPVAGTLAASGGGLERPAGNGNELDFCIPYGVPHVSGTLAASQSGHMPGSNRNELDFCVPVAIDVRNLNAGSDISGTLQAKKSGGYSLNYTNPVYVPEDFVGFGNKEGEISGCITTTWAKGHGGPSGDEAYNLVVATLGHTKAHGLGITEQDISNTLEAVSSANQAVARPGNGVRRLTPLECERLQGFPDNWTADGQTDGHRYRQLGNAVCVNVIRWLGNRILMEVFDAENNA